VGSFTGSLSALELALGSGQHDQPTGFPGLTGHFAQVLLMGAGQVS
jgi:hypothetical protein